MVGGRGFPLRGSVMFGAPFVSADGVFDPGAVASLREALLASPFVGRSTLGGGFKGSRGFAVTFRRDGLSKVTERFPFVAGFLQSATDPRASRGLLSLRERLFGRAEVPNAFFLNLLLLGEGGSVNRHVDATLRGPSGVADAVPRLVSVLYLSVPKGDGGRLQLYEGSRPVASVAPREGTLLHFRGDLAHEVTALSGSSEGSLRASLVLEQYRFDEEALARLPELHVQSRAGFGAYLKDHQARGVGGATAFELERGDGDGDTSPRDG